MSAFDHEFDVVVVGSGGGALTAAITARAAGLRTLVLEKTAKVGGTTSFSGGLFWIAANPLMREARIPDSETSAIEYLDALSSAENEFDGSKRRAAYVRNGAPMVDLLRAHGLEPEPCVPYPDYYPDLPGASAGGRPLEPRPFDTRHLGEWRERLRPQSLLPRRLKIRSSEFVKVSLARRSLAGKIALAQVGLRSGTAMARRASLVVGGEALVGRLLEIALTLGVEIWTDSPVTEFVTDGARVDGVVVGDTTRIAATRGVIVAAGGFAHNAAMRDRFSRQPSSTAWTKANEGETGDLLRIAMDLGAAVAGMNEAWYSPMSMMPNGAMIPHNTDRTKPHSIIVDANGDRYVSEASNYNRIGKIMYEHNKTAPAIPSWLVIDSNHRRRYPFFTAPPGRTPSAWLESGYLKKGATLADLANECGIDPAGLERTVKRFNAMVQAGRDTDFDRGENAYERYMADPTVKPNASLGVIERAPFYAVAIFPGDLGTCGGLVTNELAQVTRAADGSAIPGLYAAGNVTAPLAGGEYWGAGASIGASMTFGYIAAHHCVG